MNAVASELWAFRFSKIFYCALIILVGASSSQLEARPLVLLQSMNLPSIQVAEDGVTNEVLLRLEPGELESLARELGVPGGNPSLYETERAVVKAVTARGATAGRTFGDARSAEFLIRNRIPDDVRAALDGASPLERLQRYLVLRYETPLDGRRAVRALKAIQGIHSVGSDTVGEISWMPNDPYYGYNLSGPERFQWGLRAMRFSEAWNTHLGHAYVAVVDTGYLGDVPFAPEDIGNAKTANGNNRPQFYRLLGYSCDPPPYVGPGPNECIWAYHGTHVSGIIAAQADNGLGMAGACPHCSLAHIQFSLTSRSAEVRTNQLTRGLYAAIEGGAQVINMSFDIGDGTTCDEDHFEPAREAFCAALELGAERDVVMVAAAGNFGIEQTFRPPGSSPHVLNVAGAQAGAGWMMMPRSWESWDEPAFYKVGSARAGLEGVVGPAKNVVSTVPVGMEYIPNAPFFCGDNAGVDQSGTPDDGFGSCTGTSMAAPHVAGLAGIMRSISPLSGADEIMEDIRASGSDADAPNPNIGHGLPHAGDAVASTLQRNPQRLTPLFELYSNKRRDFFYTTSPQMAAAASWGTLLPVQGHGLFADKQTVLQDNDVGEEGPADDCLSTSDWDGPCRTGTGLLATAYDNVSRSWIAGYTGFPGEYPFISVQPSADVWIFTTPDNPSLLGPDLVPLYRMSWKCGDPTPNPPAICEQDSVAMDTAYASSEAQLQAYLDLGYQKDGIEGYLYDRNALIQPSGTVRLLQRYNRERDDHAIFPEDRLALFENQRGYDEIVNDTGILGFVYRNVDGTKPMP